MAALKVLIDKMEVLTTSVSGFEVVKQMLINHCILVLNSSINKTHCKCPGKNKLELSYLYPIVSKKNRHITLYSLA